MIISVAEVMKCHIVKFKLIFHVKTDDDDTKDVLLAREEYYMRILSFTQFHCLNTPFFSYTQPRKKRSHGHRKSNLQTALDYTDFIYKINDLYTTREHRTLYTLLRSVSQQYLKNTLYHIASENKSIRLEAYQIILAFYSQFCQPKKSISKHIVYFTLPFVHKLQEDVNLNRILNCKAVKSHLPLPAKKFNIYISYKYGPTIGQKIFNYNKVLSSLPLYKEGDLLACDCNDKFSKFVYKPHGHVHTGNLELIENVPLRNIMKMGSKFRETPPCNKNKLTYLYRDAIEQLTKK